MSGSSGIVLVEGDSDFRAQLTRDLESEGLRVIGPSGGTSFDRHRAGGTTADLILLDGMPPGEDGLAIRRRLRDAGGTPGGDGREWACPIGSDLGP